MKKQLLLIIGLVVIIAISSIWGYKAYANHRLNEKIDEFTSEISAKQAEFDKSKLDSKKVEILRSLESDKEIKALATDEDYKSVSKKYQDSISNMQKYFSKKYSAEIKENTIEDLAAVTSKDEIIAKQTKLNSLQEEIEKNAQYTLDKTTQKSLNGSINELLDAYNKRCMGIDEEIRIAAEKAAAEAKAKAEAAAKAAAAKKSASKPSSSASKPSSGSSSSGGSTASKPSSSGHGYIVKTVWTVENGQPKYKMWDIYSDGWYYVYPDGDGSMSGWVSPDIFAP